MHVDLNDKDINVILAALDLLVRQNGMKAAGQAMAIHVKLEGAKRDQPQAKEG